MKIIRSTKCSLKFLSKNKRDDLNLFLSEYSNVVNFFINQFWNVQVKKKELLKNIVNSSPSWISARAKKVAARQAIDMVSSVLNNEEKNKKKSKPKHIAGVHISSTLAELQAKKSATSFDYWLHLSSLGTYQGKKIIIDIPIRSHKHFEKWKNHTGSKRLNSYIISKDYVQFCFEITTQPKKTEGKILGIDTGIKALGTTSFNGDQFGLDIEKKITTINRCKYGSNRQKSLRRGLKQYIDETVKQVFSQDLQLIAVEKLRALNKNTRKRRSLGRKMRAVIGSWNYSYWLSRLQQRSEINRVSFRLVSPHYTSQECFNCGFIDKKNRNGLEFSCQSCNHLDHADKNAAKIILKRFILGQYGAEFKERMWNNMSEYFSI